MIHAIRIDGDVEERVKEFNVRLGEHQKIVSMAVSGDYLFLTVEKKERPANQNLLGVQILADQLKRGSPK